MKAKVQITKEVEITRLIVNAGVRYWEDSTVNGAEDTEGDLIPCRVGGSWCPEIDIDKGIILNWEQGKAAMVHYKVCDQCGWKLIDADGNLVYTVEDEYVPDTLCPADKGYGDYIIMNIDENGKIDNWSPDLYELLETEEI